MLRLACRARNLDRPAVDSSAAEAGEVVAATPIVGDMESVIRVGDKQFERSQVVFAVTARVAGVLDLPLLQAALVRLRTVLVV